MINQIKNGQILPENYLAPTGPKLVIEMTLEPIACLACSDVFSHEP